MVAPLHFEVCVVLPSTDISSISSSVRSGPSLFEVETVPPLLMRRRFDPTGPGKFILLSVGRKPDEEVAISEIQRETRKNITEIYFALYLTVFSIAVVIESFTSVLSFYEDKNHPAVQHRCDIFGFRAGTCTCKYLYPYSLHDSLMIVDPQL